MLMTRRQTKGSTLLEVLIALILLSGGVLSTALLYANSLQYSKMAQTRGMATDIALELADRMRANAGTAYAFADSYDENPAEVEVPACTIPTACTPNEIAAIDIAEVRNRLRLSLPGGWLRVQTNAAADMANIWIMWTDPDAVGSDETSLAGNCPDGVDGPQCLPMRVSL